MPTEEEKKAYQEYLKETYGEDYLEDVPSKKKKKGMWSKLLKLLHPSPQKWKDAVDSAKK